jgi:hypothetical protein
MTGSPVNGNRSNFVTVVAWVFIVFSGFGTLISLLQNLMIAQMHSDERFGPLMRDSSFAQSMPSIQRFMFTHLQAVVFVGLLMAIITLIASIGLLKRRNWARIVFVGLLSLSVVYLIFALVAQQRMFASMNTMFPGDSSAHGPAMANDPAERMRRMFAVFRVIMYTLEIGMAVVFAWIVAKLVSRPIREEFS